MACVKKFADSGPVADRCRLKNRLFYFAETTEI